MMRHDIERLLAEIKAKDAEIERLQDSKRRALAIADERSKENVLLRAALKRAEEADKFHANCQECEGEDDPEACDKCFPLADDARCMRRLALAEEA